MKLIPVNHGRFAKVSDSDYSRARQHKWCSYKSCRTFYARGMVDGKPIDLHRFIIGIGPYITDHRNGDGLDCRRSNLRKCSCAQNVMNTRKQRGLIKKTTSKYKGVSLCGGRNKRWTAKIKGRFLGAFYTQIDASKAYDKAARLAFGAFAKLNHPIERFTK